MTENPSEQPSQTTSSQQAEKSENDTSQKDSPPSTDKGKGIGKKSGLLGALSTLPPKDNDSSPQNISQPNATIEKESKNDKEDKSTENADAKKAPEIDVSKLPFPSLGSITMLIWTLWVLFLLYSNSFKWLFRYCH